MAFGCNIGAEYKNNPFEKKEKRESGDNVRLLNIEKQTGKRYKLSIVDGVKKWLPVEDVK